jgi:FAD/FMN-containing dehydrogenase
MLSPEPTLPDPALLRDVVAGHIVAPGDDGWDAARSAWNLAADQRPALVAIPHTVADVQAIVAYAAGNGLRIAMQGTGHNAGAIDSLAGSVLVRTHEMRGVEIDVEHRRARVLAGDLWDDVVQPASAVGLMPLAGSSPDVGVVGYSLGGGIGWMARKRGLAANSVTAIELVTAEGELIRADAEHHEELFWSLRGGGASPAAVVAMEMQLYAVPELVSGALFFDAERTREVFHAWRDWVRTVPEELTSCVRLLQFPPLPDIPEPMRGNSFAVVEATLLGSAEEAARLLAPLRALAPQMDTVAPVAPAALVRLHMDPEHPVPGITGGQLLRDLRPASIDALMDVAGPGTGSPLLSIEIRHLGGALAVAPENAGALATLDGSFIAFGVGIPMDAEVAAAIGGTLGAMKGALAADAADRSYLNFSEHAGAAKHAFDPMTIERLRAVRAEYDPEGTFRAAHALDA